MLCCFQYAWWNPRWLNKHISLLSFVQFKFLLYVPPQQRITVRPEVIELLTNGDVYNSVCNSIFDNKQPIVGHWAVIQCLSRNGFYVVEDGDIPVTDSTLQQKKPFRKVGDRND